MYLLKEFRFLVVEISVDGLSIDARQSTNILSIDGFGLSIDITSARAESL